jgi:hypothetical protein
MSLCKRFPWVRRFIRILNGGSRPILAEASDGLFYVVKFANNPQGPSVLFNEAMGAALYREFGLPVPEWTPLRVANSFFDQNPVCRNETWDGRCHRTSGLCFGSRFVGGDGIRLKEILPKCDFRKVKNLQDFWLAWLLDACADHVDNRQAIFRQEEDGQLTAFFVDSGHMFGGANNDLHCKPFAVSHYWDYRIYPFPAVCSILDFPIMQTHRAVGSLRAEYLWNQMKNLPDEWVSTQALEAYANCMNLLANPELLQTLYESMVDLVRQRRVSEAFDPQREQELLALNKCPKVSLEKLAAGNRRRSVA